MSQASNTIAITTPAAPALVTAARPASDIARFHRVCAMGAGFPAIAGIILYGWRAVATLLVILPTAWAAILIWRKVGARGRQLHLAHGLWLAMLLWMMLPAHLLNTATPDTAYSRWDPWPIPVVAAILLVMATWLLGGIGSGRIHPVLVTYLLLVVLFPQLTPNAVLQRHRILIGDITSAGPPQTPITAYAKDGYFTTPKMGGYDALHLDPFESRLLAFTSGQARPGRSWLSLESLLRDQMPPLEDLIIGAKPGPIGTTCCVAIIIGGLFLLYRGVIDFRVPLGIFIGAYIAFLSLPIPVIIKETNPPPATLTAVQTADRGGPIWRWFIFRKSSALDVGPAKAVTFANYEMMAGPMLMMTFFLATAPAIRPMTRRARVVFGLLVGVLAAGMQLYLSISFGPYLALLLISLLTPALDRLFRQHPLV